jgi:hypothetical protein
MSEVLDQVASPVRITTIDVAVASRVAEALNHAEEQIDLAVAAVAELQSKMLGARMHAGLAACVGQQALVNAGEAQTLLIQSRGAMVGAHKQLAKVQKAAGLETVSWGPLGGKDMG